MNWFNGLSIQWKILIIVALLLILLYLKRKYWSSFMNLFQAKEITPSNVILPNGQVVVVSNSNDIPQSQKTVLEGLAGSIKNDIYGLNVGGYRNTALYKPFTLPDKTLALANNSQSPNHLKNLSV